MQRFRGLDGLRGWLAWVVVLHHVILFTGLSARFPVLRAIHPLGDGAVSIFIILSGFVITHLLIEKREPYRVFVARRWLRVFPIYFVALVLGVFATYAWFDALLDSQQSAFVVTDIARLQHVRDSLQSGRALAANLALHGLMLHGAVPSNLLFNSQYMFLAPAWSLSLEWQFYLVAPFVVWAARRKLPSVALAALAAVAFELYAHGRFGAFTLPSFLPGAAPLFAVGIASRLLLERPGGRGSWVALVVLGCVFVYDHQSLWPVGLWCAFLYVAVAKSLPYAGLRTAFDALFDSVTANRIGVASYSTYLLHFPILQLLMWMSVRPLALDAFGSNVLTVGGTFLLSYFASQWTYRWIESPAVSIGKHVGRMARE